MSRPRVAGRCPACGCDGTLFLADGDYITCSLDKCPDPTLVADFLDKRGAGPDTHVVVFTRNDWHLEHTMRCRLDGMSNCLIHRALMMLDGKPVTKVGRYRVEMVSGELFYDEVPT